MTSLTVQDGKLVVRNGALGTTQACCCGQPPGLCEPGCYCFTAFGLTQILGENACAVALLYPDRAIFEPVLVSHFAAVRAWLEGRGFTAGAAAGWSEIDTGNLIFPNDPPGGCAYPCSVEVEDPNGPGTICIHDPNLPIPDGVRLSNGFPYSCCGEVVEMTPEESDADPFPEMVPFVPGGFWQELFNGVDALGNPALGGFNYRCEENPLP